MMKIYDRRLTPILVKEVDLPRIVVLTGMRQVGKTTVMRQVYNSIETKHKIFLDLENPLNRKIFEEENFDNILINLEGFGFSSKKKFFIFLDEVQLAPQIVKVIKYLHDHYSIKFFLTGSSSFYLKDLFPESLAGRKVLYELFPLYFEEFLVFRQKKKQLLRQFRVKAKKKNRISWQLYSKLFDEYLEFGGFPAVVIEEGRGRKRQILEDVFTSYFEKDIRALADFRELNKLRDLILLFAARAGSKIEISKIASEIGISRETVYSYLNFLEKTYFIFLVNPYTKNRDGEVKGAKKIYFCDNGLLNYLGKVSTGSLFENLAFHNLKKYGKLNYYQRYKGSEIDFILNEKIACEVKVKAGQFDINRLKKIAAVLELKEYYVISKEYCDFSKVILSQDL